MSLVKKLNRKSGHLKNKTQKCNAIKVEKTLSKITITSRTNPLQE
jgi:hypothetical protein